MNAILRTFTIGLAASAVLAAAAAASAGELAVGEPARLPTRGLSCTPDAAWGKDGYLVVWQEGWHGLGGAADILAARVSPDGKPVDAAPIVVCDRPGVQARPKVAFSPAAGAFLVVWHELRADKDFDVCAARVSGDGRVLDAQPLRLAATADVNEADPVVASDGADFLVVWSCFKMAKEAKGGGEYPSYDIQAVRVGGSGRPTDAAPIAVAAGGFDPAVASDGKGYLVVYTNAVRAGVSGVRLGADGKPADAKPLDNITATGAGCTEWPAVAATAGKGYLATASRNASPDWWGWGGPGAFMAGRVAPDGQTPDAAVRINGWTWGQITDATAPNVIDSCRWGRKNGAEAVKGWPKGQPGGFRFAYKDEWPFSYSAVASDGRGGCVAAWTLGHLTGTVNVNRFDVRVRRLDPFADWAKGEKVDAAATDAEETMPALAAGPPGRLLLVYELIEAGKGPVIAVRTIQVK